MAERQIEALSGEMANRLILCWPILPALGEEGEGEKGGRKENWCSLSSLRAPILFSGFPFHEEIVASRVTRPFKDAGKRACVCEHKGIHHPPPPPPPPPQPPSLDNPHDTHRCHHSGREILRKVTHLWFKRLFVIAPKQ